MINIGVLGSTNGTDLQFIFNAIDEGKLDANVSVVISNKEDSYILKRAQAHNTQNVFISHRNKDREDFDSEMTMVLKEHNTELILLIGFMRILSSKFCNQWKGKILNVHPSLLPKYAGGMDTNVHEEVLKNNDKETGCTIHLVTDEVDKGPVVIQKRCLVDSDDTIESLKAKVQNLEGDAFLEAIPLFSNNG
ncbi:MAG: phosphoribosylglycinamide formyltransferase [Candidatus Marinimicrobia bacterium]|nr:phosphoribosylglycinamide formyltransferase [Candidatus Neomarinimicrobiota bacterium]|tara:strand:+ start:228 stop:803 length:576 start_codon:yes stop_codon:yes gene_type:complete